MSNKYACADILQFQEQLKVSRDLDDKLTYALNMSLPTASIKARNESNEEVSCRSLFNSLRDNYLKRGEIIDECIVSTIGEVSQLKKQTEGSNDTQLEKKYKSEQRKLRILKTEKSVEDIVKERTLKAFNERCRQFYRAESF